MRCVEGYGPNLYVGGSDGVVEWWVCDGDTGGTQVSMRDLSGESDRPLSGSGERLDPSIQTYTLPSTSGQQDHPPTESVEGVRPFR